MELGRGMAAEQLSDVEGDVKVEGVRTVPRDLHVFGPIPQPLQPVGNLKRNLRLAGSHKNHDPEVFTHHGSQLVGLHVFEINQNNLRLHVSGE